MGKVSSGLVDKLYWRRGAGSSWDVWHCFKKDRSGLFRSLCGRAMLSRPGTQACRRPSPVWRCGLCDGLEAKRRGWEESGPTSK